MSLINDLTPKRISVSVVMTFFHLILEKQSLTSQSEWIISFQR